MVAGYVHLVESEYQAISDLDKYYAKSIKQQERTLTITQCYIGTK